MGKETEMAKKVHEGLYGPKFCVNCKKVQPVETHELAGSAYSKVEGTTMTFGFTGTQICRVCRKTVTTS